MSTTDESLTPEEFTDVEAGMIRVNVGEGKRSFLIHKKLACASSPFFDKCVGDAGFKEGQENVVNLPEDHPEAFALIVNHLYKYPIRNLHCIAAEVVAAEAYVLADKLGILSCKNTIIDAIRSYHQHEYISGGLLNMISPRYVDHLPLWDYYAEQAARDLTEVNNDIWKDKEKRLFQNGVEKFFDNGGPFAVKVVARMVPNAIRSVNDPARYPGCVYHDHSDGSSCQIGNSYSGPVAWTPARRRPARPNTAT